MVGNSNILKQKIASLMDVGDHLASLSLCNEFCRAGGGDKEIWFRKALNEFRLGQDAEAFRTCQQSLDRFGAQADVLNLLGCIQMKSGQLSEAAVSFAEALKSDERHVSAHENLAHLFLGGGDLPAACRHLNRVVEIQPGHSRAWFLLGAAQGQLGRFEKAVESSRKAIALDPENIEAYFNLGQACMHLNRLDEAIAAYQQVIARNPDHFDAWNSIAVALHELNRPAEAIPYYQQALRIRPDSAPTRYMLASAGGDEAPATAPPEYVKDLFDKYAHKFEKQLVEDLQYRTPQLLDDMIRDHLGVIAGESATSGNREALGMTILDFGCGTGLCGPLVRDLAEQLTGLDLSPKMLEKAAEKGVYDHLVAGDLDALLAAQRPEHKYDLIIGADVFPYIGALDASFSSFVKLLKNRGVVAMSVEACEDTDSYVLRDTNRYAHALDYVRQRASSAGLAEISVKSVVLRRNRGKPVNGYLFLFGLHSSSMSGRGAN